MTLLLALLTACDGGAVDVETEQVAAPDPIAPARTAETCDPVLHNTQGPTGDDAIAGYLLHGASEDGRKLAIVYRDGNLSLERPDRYTVYTAGSREATMAAIPRREGPPSVTADIGDPNVDGKYVPDPVAWCLAGDQVIIEGLGTWTWSHVEEPCSDEDSATLNWLLCPPEGNCARPTHLPGGACWDDPTVLVDLYLAGDVLWVVAERPRTTYTPRMAGGVVVTR